MRRIDDIVAVQQQHSSGTEPGIVLWVVAWSCLGWFIFNWGVSLVGYIQLWRHYASPKPPSRSASMPEPPGVTIIRPVKGLEPYLYECLASTFRQTYARSKISTRLCVASRQDPALPILKKLLDDFQDHDAQILIESEDTVLQRAALGPNPKIRNMSRAYRESRSDDVIWIVDCNVWVAKDTLGRMVDTLHGDSDKVPVKFVHLLPLVVDVTADQGVGEGEHLLVDESRHESVPSSTDTDRQALRPTRAELGVWDLGGGRLEEQFMSSSHAKYYTAINTVLVAPCIVGKSTMFRRAHLDAMTEGRGIDFFSENICEDHLIGDLLWKRQAPEEIRGQKWAKHRLVFGDLAIQPMAGMSVKQYIARRVRWLRVRKFTVFLATLVEPCTESFLCSLLGAFAVTALCLVPGNWSLFWTFWLLSVVSWCFLDRTLYNMLQSGASVESDADTPLFARAPKAASRREVGPWLAGWVGREFLAFPIWFWAFFCGTTVTWRGQRFWVGLDLKAHAIEDDSRSRAD